MEEHQIHFGRKFYKDKQKGYWISTDYPRIRAHQWVWINYHGKIPKGYHIHHKDDDKSNNLIQNLELLERSAHHKLHLNCPKRKEKCRQQAEKIRPLTKKWHASTEGKAWHKLHALKHNFGNWELKDYICQVCGKDYQSKLIAKERSKFCSNNCKSEARRRSSIDIIDYPCERCGILFKKDKYAKRKYCKPKCKT
jgi:hypothetical protein